MSRNDHLHEMLSAHGREKSLPADSLLFRCGDRIERLYYVVTGELRALRHLPDGHSAIMMRAGAGEFFAAASIHLLQFPCDGYVPVVSEVIGINIQRFLKLLERDACLATGFAKALSLELKKQCGRLERMRLNGAKDRLLHYIACETLDGRTLLLNVPLTQLASELGIEPESLYRTLSQLERGGRIIRSRDAIRLVEP